MEFSFIPIIVICCYIIGEFYKFFFKKNSKQRKFIPLLVTICGGILGIIMFYTDKEMMFDIISPWQALEIGLFSGASSTGANQMFKKLFKNISNKETNI